MHLVVLLKSLKYYYPYRDAGAADKMNPFAEQEAWEEHQIGKCHSSEGSSNVLSSDSETIILQGKQQWNLVPKIKSKHPMTISKYFMVLLRCLVRNFLY